MVCTICSRFLGARPDGIPFFCVSCARSTLYETRLEHAKTLLDRARLGGQVEAIVEPSEATAGQSIALSSGTLIDVNESAKQVELERVQEDTVLARDSSRLVSEQITLLRCQIRQRRGSIGDRHEALGKRRAELAASRQRLADRSAKSLEQLKTVIKGGEMTWGKIHQQTVVGRADLCREAADLAGLRSRVRKVKDGSTRLEYVIGGMAIPDLVDMSSTPPHQLSAALAHVARLLVLVAGYLHVRLPAEITLPHRKYPMSTIFLPTSSYLGKDIPFPVGSTGKYSVQADGPETNRIERTEIQRLLSLLPSASSTPLASKQTLAAQQQQQQQALQKRALPRPRPLWVDRTLATLMKEDPNAYLLFVEAITLLAWDVAWLCHSQGLSEIGYLSTWQDVCRVGRNLHELLVVQLNHIVARPPLSRKGTSNSAATATTTAAATATRTISSATTTAVAVTAANGGTAGVISADKKANGGSAVNGGKAAAVFGVYSHGTTHSYLGTAAGQQRLRSWKWLHQFKLLLDNVRGALASDMNYAEWELLASKEWSQQNPDGFAPRQD